MATYGDLEVTLSTGLELVGEPEVGGNVYTFTAVGTKSGVQSISVSYAGGEEQTVTKIVIPEKAVVNTMSADVTNLKVGEDATITLVFNKALTQGQGTPTMVLSAGLQEKVPFVLNANRDGGTYVVTAIASGVQSIISKLGKKQTVLSIPVDEEPAVLQTVTVDNSTVSVGDPVVVTAIFDKAPTDVSEVNFVLPNANFVQTVAPAIVGNTVTVTYTAVIAGTIDVEVQYGATTEYAPQVTITQPAVVKAVHMYDENDIEITSIEAGKVVKFEALFNTAVDDVSDLILTLPTDVTQVTAFTLAADGLSGSGTYTVTKMGSVTFDVEADDGSKADVTVTAVSTSGLKLFTADNTTVTGGNQVTFTATLNSADIQNVIDLDNLAGDEANVFALNVPSTWTEDAALTFNSYDNTVTATYTTDTTPGDVNVTLTVNGSSHAADTASLTITVE
jgi:hypothetical protein